MTSTDFQEELCARSRCDLSDLRHLGYTVPPQPDAGWIGEAGPGPVVRRRELRRPANDFTNRTTTFMTWNVLRLARMLEDAGGLPAQASSARCGTRAAVDFANPDYR